MISQYGKHDRTRLLVNIQACKQKYLLGRGLRVGNQPKFVSCHGALETQRGRVSMVSIPGTADRVCLFSMVSDAPLRAGYQTD